MSTASVSSSLAANTTRSGTIDPTHCLNGRPLDLSSDAQKSRLPVPSLWLDVFHKIKALGFNGVSFYVDWALLEGTPGEFTAEGVFAWEPFFDAAQEAGIYLLAVSHPQWILY